MKIAFLFLGSASSAVLLAAIVWSILIPSLRVWPPVRSTTLHKTVVWALTLVYFTAVLCLGIADWNAIGWHAGLRWGLGVPLILAGNFVVWRGARELGWKATSGEATRLRTEGLYRLSRNPQYVADIAILLGWSLLSGSVWLMPLATCGILALFLAPFAEEPWLKENYGTDYVAYKARVARYL